MSVIVSLSLASICFMGTCYPALVGKDTPVGTFTLNQLITEQAGYGGDVLEFHSDEKTWFAVHRVWLLRPEQKREQRLQSKNPKDRMITKGCVNVMPSVYTQLAECCIGATLVVTP